MVRDIAREADQWTRRCRPLREGGPVGADDALWELGHDGIWKTLWTPLPDVSAAVGRRGDASRATAEDGDAR